MWRTRPCDRRDPGTGNSATNSKLPRPSIKAAADHAGPLRTPFPSRRLRFLKPRQIVVCLVEPRSNGIARETRRLPPRTLEFSWPSPQKIVPSPRKFTEDPLCDVRNPRNGAAIFAVPRLNLLCSCSCEEALARRNSFQVAFFYNCKVTAPFCRDAVGNTISLSLRRTA